jgi:hypothetical protein
MLDDERIRLQPNRSQHETSMLVKPLFFKSTFNLSISMAQLV